MVSPIDNMPYPKQTRTRIEDELGFVGDLNEDPEFPIISMTRKERLLYEIATKGRGAKTWPELLEKPFEYLSDDFVVDEDGYLFVSDEFESIQKKVLPEPPTDDMEGKIYQYIGETDEKYVNGYFYKCVFKWTDPVVTVDGFYGPELVNLSVDEEKIIDYFGLLDVDTDVRASRTEIITIILGTGEHVTATRNARRDEESEGKIYECWDTLDEFYYTIKAEGQIDYEVFVKENDEWRKVGISYARSKNNLVWRMEAGDLGWLYFDKEQMAQFGISYDVVEPKYEFSSVSSGLGNITVVDKYMFQDYFYDSGTYTFEYSRPTLGTKNVWRESSSRREFADLSALGFASDNEPNLGDKFTVESTLGSPAPFSFFHLKYVAPKRYGEWEQHNTQPAGSGPGPTSVAWNEILDKPFNSVGNGLYVDANRRICAEQDSKTLQIFTTNGSKCEYMIQNNRPSNKEKK